MLGAQRPHQRVLHQVVGGFRVARERTGITPERRDRGFDALLEGAQARSPHLCRNAIGDLVTNNTGCLSHIPGEAPARTAQISLVKGVRPWN